MSNKVAQHSRPNYQITPLIHKQPSTLFIVTAFRLHITVLQKTNITFSLTIVVRECKTIVAKYNVDFTNDFCKFLDGCIQAKYPAKQQCHNPLDGGRS